jgi:catechol 2,3-dioxygenase-like lactoylglutathione lyase family enzyme
MARFEKTARRSAGSFERMINGVSYVNIWVRDQDEAKAFYTEKLGFEVREDATLDELGGYRWLTVGPPDQPDVSLILGTPGPPAFEEGTSAAILELVAKGALGPGIFRTDDCRATCEEIKARGVELAQEPEERFYGIDAAVRDPSGNLFRIVQAIEYDLEAMQRAQGANSAS